MNKLPAIATSISTYLTLMDSIDDDSLTKMAVKNADSINESFYSEGVHSKNALKLIFKTLELSNILLYKIVEQDDAGACLIYIEKTIYPSRIMKLYFLEYIKYFCKLNRLSVEISGTEKKPIFRITTQNGGVFI